MPHTSSRRFCLYSTNIVGTLRFRIQSLFAKSLVLEYTLNRAGRASEFQDILSNRTVQEISESTCTSTVASPTTNKTRESSNMHKHQISLMCHLCLYSGTYNWQWIQKVMEQLFRVNPPNMPLSVPVNGSLPLYVRMQLLLHNRPTTVSHS